MSGHDHGARAWIGGSECGARLTRCAGRARAADAQAQREQGWCGTENELEAQRQKKRLANKQSLAGATLLQSISAEDAGDIFTNYGKRSMTSTRALRSIRRRSQAGTSP